MWLYFVVVESILFDKTRLSRDCLIFLEKAGEINI